MKSKEEYATAAPCLKWLAATLIPAGGAKAMTNGRTPHLKLRQLYEGNHFSKLFKCRTYPVIEARIVLLSVALYNHSPSNCELSIRAQQLFTNFTDSKHSESSEPAWQTHPSAQPKSPQRREKR